VQYRTEQTHAKVKKSNEQEKRKKERKKEREKRG